MTILWNYVKKFKEIWGNLYASNSSEILKELKNNLKDEKILEHSAYSLI